MGAVGRCSQGDRAGLGRRPIEVKNRFTRLVHGEQSSRTNAASPIHTLDRRRRR